jgi:Kef-type K+ transport system membrane component KefB
MHGVMLLIIQIGVIIIVSRLVGWLLAKFHQPQVMGEMMAGILLGPSLLGLVAPGVSAIIFPPDSLTYLNLLSQIGLLLFMFLVGLELDPRLLQARSRTAIVISHASIIAPFVLGITLALYLYPRHSVASVSFTGFALFMGAAMSVTAFPVLARILNEREMVKTKLGALTLACAAVDDITAWSILATVIAIVRSTGMRSLVFTVVGSLAYIALMFYLVRPLLRRFETVFRRDKGLSQHMIAIIVLLLLGSAFTTEWLGIHALFGAFLAGAMMPKQEEFIRAFSEKFEDLTVVLLLPLFFAYTGLRTRIGLVSGEAMWLDCALIISVAIVGKFGGSTIAARFTGLNWREASGIGILMNTRGLMELVILTIGLDIGVISPAIFAMMVIMALFTTFMTSPLLELIYPTRIIRAEILANQAALKAAPDGQVQSC